MSDSAEIDAARARFKSFHKREPREGELVSVQKPGVNPICLEVGELVGIAYKASGDGKRYYHDFGKRKARVFVTADGRQVFLIGGDYTFTDRGFIG